jgi:hypothetical protein
VYPHVAWPKLRVSGRPLKAIAIISPLLATALSSSTATHRRSIEMVRPQDLKHLIEIELRFRL